MKTKKKCKVIPQEDVWAAIIEQRDVYAVIFDHPGLQSGIWRLRNEPAKNVHEMMSDGLVIFVEVMDHAE